MGTDVVSAQHLVKRYRGKQTPAVDDISFAIAEGETIGLLGPNGAGKTTLMKMICGVTPPTTGQIRVFGADPGRDPVAAKNGIGAMHQSAPYDEMLSGLDNLRIATKFKGLDWKSTAPWALEVAEYLGLSEALPQLVFQLSGGQRQRLQLVRALLTLPKLLILDEPSAGLDVAGRHEIEKFVRWLRDDSGMTVIWTSHIMEEIERNAQRILVIDKGRVVRFAAPTELAREFGGAHLVVQVDDALGAKVVVSWAESAGLTASAQDTEVRIDNAQVRDVLPPLSQHCLQAGVAISGVSTVADSLETVFLRMTENKD